MKHDKAGLARKVDVTLKKARARGYAGLLLPGGVMNPDTLRRDPAAVKLVQQFWKARKPVAAICHGPQLLIEAKVLRGRRMTSFPSLQTDLRNAGARWVDRQVVVDGDLVTSRRPADIPAFNRAMIALFRANGKARNQRPGSGQNETDGFFPTKRHDTIPRSWLTDFLPRSEKPGRLRARLNTRRLTGERWRHYWPPRGW